MSVQQEIQRIESAKTSLKTAIEGKGVTVPDGTKLDGYGALVSRISQSGGGSGGGGGVTVEILPLTMADYVSTSVDITGKKFALFFDYDPSHSLYSALNPGIGVDTIYNLTGNPQDTVVASQSETSVYTFKGDYVYSRQVENGYELVCKPVSLNGGNLFYGKMDAIYGDIAGNFVLIVFD